MKTKSPLPWFGSDSEVGAQIAGHFDSCTHVTIPFVGGAGIIQHLKARGIVGNDMNRAAINFFRFMSDPKTCEELVRMCESTLSHPEELKDAIESLCNFNTTIHHAWAFWAVCWVGRKGKGGTKSMGGQASVRWTGVGGNNASRLQAASEDLRAWSQSFRRVEWICEDFRKVLDKVNDRKDCGVYCDPPWVEAGRNYLHNFTEQDHIDLRDLLAKFRSTKILVRYGDCELIRGIYTKESGWNIYETFTRTQSGVMIKEIWIVNGEL